MKKYFAICLLVAGLALPALSAHAQACYRSVCAPDADGTQICINDEIDCDSLKCLQCTEGCDNCARCDQRNAEYRECTTPDGRTATYFSKPEKPYERVYEGPEGGLSGNGADAGGWERRNFYSEIRDWYHAPPDFR